MTEEQSERGRAIFVAVGAALVLLGLWAGVATTGLVPPAILRLWSDLRGPLGLVIAGAAIIWMGRGGFKPPVAGMRLYRSRDDRWVSGVLGGLARYYSLDATMLRIVFLVLVLIGTPWLVIGYLLMALFVPLEPGPPRGLNTAGQPNQPNQPGGPA